MTVKSKEQIFLSQVCDVGGEEQNPTAQKRIKACQKKFIILYKSKEKYVAA